MSKKYPLAMLMLASLLSACSSGDKVGVVENADVSNVGAKGTALQDAFVHFNEGNAIGKTTYQQAAPTWNQSQVIFVPEKATAICNDGTFSMSLLNEACLNNGGVKMVISRYQSN